MEEQRLNDDIREIKERLGRHSNRLQSLEAFQLKESTELTQLKSEIRVMDGTMKSIQKTQKETQEEVGELKEDVSGLADKFDEYQKKSDVQYRKLAFLVIVLVVVVIWKDSSSLQKILSAISAAKSLGI